MNILSKIAAPVKEVILHTATCNEERFTKESKKLTNVRDYYSNYYDSNLYSRVEPPAMLTFIKERMIENILDKEDYSFKRTLVIKNPFRISPLSAMVVFNTEKECMVEYTVKGKNNSSDYTKCDETVTKRHRVPVLGLYEDTINSVKLRLLDKSGNELAQKTIRIKTPPLNAPVKDCVEITKMENQFDDFKFVSGGYSGGVYAFDCNGNIRFALTRIPQYYGVYLFEDGRFLFPEKNIRVPAYGNAHTVITHDMDMLGRVYHTYHQRKGLHHWAIEKEPGGNILSLSSSVVDTYMENAIVEFDRNTGETIYDLNVNDLFDDTYKTRNDWAHINSIDYIPAEESVVISMRNVHTIAKINLPKREIVWILTNPEFYKGTNVEDKVLKPEGEIAWFFQQHGIQIVHDETDKDPNTLRVMLFDNHTANRRPVEWFDGVEKSNVMFFTIDEANRTVRQDKVFETPLSITRSNSEYYPEKGRVMAMCAHFKPEVDGYKAKLYEFDYNTGKCINEMSCKTDYFTAHSFDFNVKAMSAPLNQDKPQIVGTLINPVKLDTLPEELKNAQAVTEEIMSELKFRRYGDILQISAVDHDLQKIYMYSDKNIYMQDFTDTEQPLKVFKTQRYFVNMPMMDMQPDTYKIAVQYLSKTYTTDYNVKISDEPIKSENTDEI